MLGTAVGGAETVLCGFFAVDGRGGTEASFEAKKGLAAVSGVAFGVSAAETAGCGVPLFAGRCVEGCLSAAAGAEGRAAVSFDKRVVSGRTAGVVIGAVTGERCKPTASRTEAAVPIQPE